MSSLLAGWLAGWLAYDERGEEAGLNIENRVVVVASVRVAVEV
jgi:preprotein translocase subunit Sec61beta